MFRVQISTDKIVKRSNRDYMFLTKVYTYSLRLSRKVQSFPIDIPVVNIGFVFIGFSKAKNEIAFNHQWLLIWRKNRQFNQSVFTYVLSKVQINNKEFRNMNARSIYDMKIFIKCIILLSYKLDQRQCENIIDLLLMFTG